MKYNSEECSYLYKIENHKIVYDGYNFWWYSKKNKDEDFTIHCIKPFKEYKTILSYIYFWMPKYYKTSIIENKVDLMINELLNDIKIKDIANSNIKTNEKIKLILELNPNIKVKDLCNLLNISKMAISKHLKKI